MDNSQTQEIKLSIIHLLFSLYQQDDYSLSDYEPVDDFYAHVGYNLESENLLRLLMINGTSDLQTLFIDYNAHLEGEITENDFSQKWLS